MASPTDDLVVRGDAPQVIDSSDVPGWVDSMIMGQYTNAVLATLLVYDSRKYHTSLIDFILTLVPFAVCTMDREVLGYWEILYFDTNLRRSSTSGKSKEALKARLRVSYTSW